MKNLITTPIYYINSKPHIGHFYTSLLADAFKKTNQIFNKTCYLTSGTDEHGLKIWKSVNFYFYLI